MKLIIFGATGNVGQTIAKAAVQDKQDVTLFVRNKKKLEGLLQTEILSQCRVCDTIDTLVNPHVLTWEDVMQDKTLMPDNMC